MDEDVKSETPDNTNSSNSETTDNKSTVEENDKDEENSSVKKRKIGIELDVLSDQKDRYKKHENYFIDLYKSLQNMQKKMKKEW